MNKKEKKEINTNKYRECKDGYIRCNNIYFMPEVETFLKNIEHIIFLIIDESIHNKNTDDIEEYIEEYIFEAVNNSFIYYNDEIHISIIKSLQDFFEYEYIEINKLIKEDIRQILLILAHDLTLQYFLYCSDEIIKDYNKR